MAPRGAAPPDPALPGRIGPYDVVELLGRGGMGVVYRGRDAAGVEVAVKTVTRLGRAEELGLRREIRSLARLRHPGIVRILAHGVLEGAPWYAMELVRGRPLSGAALRRADTPGWWTNALAQDAGPGERALTGAAMGVPEALTLCRRLCAPLGYLHGEGLVHRDLKPDNVMVREDGTPVLLDFGLVASFADPGARESLEVEGFSAGTAAFMSPEQLAGELVDARSDLWSLGVLLYLLLTGETPFPTVGAARDPEIAAPAPSARRQGIPREVDVVVGKLLAKSPRSRHGFADDVARALVAAGAEVGAAETPARSYLYRSGMAGRDQLLAPLGAHLRDRLHRGAGGLVLIGGESGVGKTRLLVELARSLEWVGAAVVPGSSIPGGDALHPLQPLLRRARAADGSHAPLASRVALLAPFLPEASGGAAAAPPTMASRERLVDALIALAAELARAEGRTLLIALDDLQWADEVTLAWIARLAAEPVLDDAPVVVLGAYRKDEAPEALARAAAGPAARSLELGRLEGPAIARMVGEMLALAAPPAPLVDAVVGASGGIPLFAVELLRASVEDGLVARGADGAWALDASRPVVLPSSLTELLEARLGSDHGARDALLAAAAVLGRRLDLDMLLSVSGLPEDALLDASAELIRRQVLDAVAPGRLRFSHDKLRELACARLGDDAARALHRRAAEALERAPGELRAWDAVVDHWRRAGELGIARERALPAAVRANERFQGEAAERLLRFYLEDPPDPAGDIDARAELAGILYLRGATEESRALHAAALAHAEARGDVRRAAISARGLATVTPDLAEAGRLYERALSLARGAGAPAPLASMIHSLGLHLADVGERARAEELYEEGRTLAAACGERRLEGRCLGGLAQIWSDRGEKPRAVAAFHRLHALYQALGDESDAAMILANIGIADLDLDPRAAAEQLAEAAESLRRIGQARSRAGVVGYLAEARFRLGDAAAGRRLFEEAIAVHRRSGNARWEVLHLGKWAEQERRAGATEAALALCDQALHVPLPEGDIVRGFRAAALGSVTLAAGRDARPHLAELERILAHLELGPGSPLGQDAELLRQGIAAAEGRRGDEALPCP